ncbi:MAG: GNAT family N-acetyltransferase [Clostridia bacterium]|nr:GNAT family N-acetyltransferase [Clostridia bacterium]
MKVLLCNDKKWIFSKDAFEIYAPCMYQPVFEKYRTKMEQYCSDPAMKIYVCEDYKQKIGMMIIDHSGDVPEIVGIAVSSRCRGQGAGRLMVERIMESEGIRSLKAQTDEDAIEFYRKCGFKDEKEIIEYPDGSAVRYNCLKD